MNKEKQRIKIAEACGWRIYESNGTMYYERPGGNVYNYVLSIRHLPDYLNDLNAMHEAEKVLDGNLGEYVKVLSRVMTGVEDFIQWPSVVAPAHKRAEAFLRTLKRWEE